MDAYMYAFKRSQFNYPPSLPLQTFYKKKKKGIRRRSLYPHTFSLVFSTRSALQEVLDQKDTFRSLRQDVLPYLVRSQLVSNAITYSIVSTASAFKCTELD